MKMELQTMLPSRGRKRICNTHFSSVSFVNHIIEIKQIRPTKSKPIRIIKLFPTETIAAYKIYIKSILCSYIQAEEF